MNILVLGSGGREHALAWKIAQDTKVTQVLLRLVMPERQQKQNALTSNLIFWTTLQLLLLLKENNVELIVVGPEAPLVMV